jgi:hypothetical protein
MPKLSRTLRAVLATLCLLALAPASASASGNAELSIIDDVLLLGAPQEEIDRNMALFSSQGVDRLRVSAFWNQLTPAADSREKPAGFDGANPADPGYAWDPLDRVITSAARHGLRVMVSISTPAPLWATAPSDEPNQVLRPSPAEFGDFTQAVVERYAQFVDHWGISNEPNQGVWLQPQSDRSGLIAPHLYRDLVQAAYPRIKAGDPVDSVALVGELAASGVDRRGPNASIRPLRFLRAMACVDNRYRPIRRGRCKGYQPVPLDAIGHHPYQLLLAPTRRSRSPDDAAISDGRRLLRVVDRLVRVGALQPNAARKPNVFYTEFGYQTNPPDPFAGVSLRTQNRYLQQAARIAARTPRVLGFNQFRLTDGPLKGAGPKRFEEFQSGLLFENRGLKPSYRSFPHPFIVDGESFWGQVRPGARHSVRVEHRRRAGARWRRVAQVLTNGRGYFSFRLRGRRAGQYRYSYTEPVGQSTIVSVGKLPRRR